MFVREYLEFLGNNAYDKMVFSDYENIHSFIEQHRWVSKEKIVGHFTIIINSVCNAIRKNPYEKKIEEDFKKLPQFYDLLVHKPKRTTEQKSHCKINLQDHHLQKLINHHNTHGHSLDGCTALLQISTAARFNEAQQFPTNESKLIEKSCDCDLNSVCKITRDTCFSSISFAGSKCGKISKSIIPQFINCYHFVKTSNQKISREKYTKFLKTTIDPEVSTHCLRGFLPNITIDSRKNIGWKSQQVFDKFYCQQKTRLFDLYILVQELGFISG